MGANCAGIYGAQLFRQDDRPRYRRGFTVNIAILAFGLGLAVIRYIDDCRRKVRRRRGEETRAGLEETDSGSDDAVRQDDRFGVDDEKKARV
jgi:hypothetical protein